MSRSPPIVPGLLSITFRSMNWEDILQQVVAAGLSAIEWGGDIHVPPGDVAHANSVRHRCEASNVRISAYGSYYRAGVDPDQFSAVLDTATALGTNVIRVWAGNLASSRMSPSMKEMIANDLRRCCSMAAPLGITIATEYHGGTLTDDPITCMELIRAVDQPNLQTFWQPPNDSEFQYALETLHAVKSKLANVHVFHWWPTVKDRLPLEEGRDRWQGYLAAVAEQCRVDGRQRFASLEFVLADDVEQFHRDAKTLLALIESCRV